MGILMELVTSIRHANGGIENSFQGHRSKFKVIETVFMKCLWTPYLLC